MERDTRKGPESEPKIIWTFDQPAKVRSDRSFLDQKELETERTQLQKNSLDALNAMLFSTGSLKDAQRFSKLRQDFLDLIQTRGHYNDILYTAEQEKGETLTVGEVLIYNCLLLGAELTIHRTLEEQLRLMQKYGDQDVFSRFSQPFEFLIAAKLSIRVGEVSLNDFMGFKKGKTSPSPYYEYLTTTPLIGYRHLHQEIFDQNKEDQEQPLINNNPNLTKEHIEILGSRINSALNMPSQPIKASAEGIQTPILKRVASSYVAFKEKIDEVQTETSQLLQNPSSSDFEAIKNLLEDYLSYDKVTRIFALKTLGLATEEDFCKLYRKAGQFIAQGNNAAFYGLLQEAVRDYIKEFETLDILTNEDIGTILDPNKKPDDTLEEAPNFEKLGIIVGQIFSKTGRAIHDIAPADINWHNLLPPQGVKVEFSSRPKKFTVLLHYENELGESTNPKYTIDASRETIDWNVLEDPMQPETQEGKRFKKNLMPVTEAILQHVYKQTEEDYMMRHTPLTTQPTVKPEPRRRERYSDPIYQERRTAREETRQHAGPASLPQVDFLESLISEQRIKNHILIPDEEIFGDKSKSMSHEDRTRIKGALEQYNENATGAEFSRLKLRGSNDEPRYKLRVGAGPNSIRVLLRESESNSDTRRFEVIDIKYRKDMYR